MEFNEQQKTIINTHGGMICVSSAAGSGKTSSLVEHINHLVNTLGESEKDIIVISFTRAAVDSLKKKLSKLSLSFVAVHTFHSLAAMILSNAGISVSKTFPLWKVDNCFKKIAKDADTESILSWIGFQKNQGRSFNDEFVFKDSDYEDSELRVFFKAYEKEKNNENAYDFEDWILMALKELKKHSMKYRFVINDETQDCNALNIQMLKLISDKNLMVIGDARQSIYGFRGSDPSFFLNFDKEFPGAKVLNLDTNYRSCKNIVEQSNNFIKPYFKEYSHYADSVSFNQENGIIGLISSMDAKEESLKIADKIQKMIIDGRDPNDIGVIYRLNKSSEFLEAELRKRKIPYDIANDSSFFKRREIKGLLGYLQLVDNVHTDGAFIDVFSLRNEPLKFMAGSVLEDVRRQAGKNDESMYETFIDFKLPNVWQQRGITEFHNNITRLVMQKDKGVSVEKLIDNVVKIFGMEKFIKDKYPNYDEQKERIASIEVLKSFVKGNNLKGFLEYANSDNIPKKKKAEGVRLMSIHRVKGLEFHTIFIVGVKDGDFPHERASSIEEEARIYYVALTRAKQELYISQLGTDNQFINKYFNK
ncbi:ATP-dependent helicase [Clostridium estertheticum]|uniref:ATP-dependent helicase n=1 Tax=Clostridium estertheticum TaxID=238834 RepID=UPI001C0DAB5E|nr:ATP-dependent helicase [Clostridium estertheticum]MBU3186635.1 ATP-dependent helicase [Clostridium estertheticum]